MPSSPETDRDSNAPERAAAAGRGRPSTHDTGSVVDDNELARLLGDFARSVGQEPDPASTLVEVVRAALDLVPGCDEASISVVRGRLRVSSEAASGPTVKAVDALQESLQQGPCLDAAYEHATVRVPDMATETRWPQFTAAALQLGVASMLSLQLYVDGDDLGALNLLSRRARAFTDESEQIGLLLAAHAAVAYSASCEKERMARGLLTQQVIGQAQGILMERHKITAERAFAGLVTASQQSNIKLRDLAERLTRSGDLPLEDPHRA